jgi:hypothetical protein
MQVVKLSRLKDMLVFKTLVTSQMRPDVRYRITYDQVRLSVKARRLLSKNRVPVGLLKMLYNNLLRCRLRHLEPLQVGCFACLIDMDTCSTE